MTEAEEHNDRLYWRLINPTWVHHVCRWRVGLNIDNSIPLPPKSQLQFLTVDRVGLHFGEFHTMFQWYDIDYNLDDYHIAIVRPRSPVETTPNGLWRAKKVEVVSLWRISNIRETYPELYSHLLSVFMWHEPEVIKWILDAYGAVEVVVPTTRDFVVPFILKLMEQLMFRMLLLEPEEEEEEDMKKTTTILFNNSGSSNFSHPWEQ